MSQPLYLVDAFAHRPFTGNPAAICPLEGPSDEAWMQSLALEMNQPETAYFWPETDGYRLRWFTPEIEVDLCGHATLASAHILWEVGLTQESEIRFQTRSGTLVASRDGETIILDFPALSVTPLEGGPDLAPILGVAVKASYISKFDLLVEGETEESVRQLTPDLRALAELPYRGVIVTAPSSGDQDFVSRFFGPATGIPEDPVTGSAHCVLGPFWAAKTGRTKLTGYQASKRGGWVGTEMVNDRVLLSGRAVTTLSGHLR
ncbi:MAG: PhzF family phenazine biosynthesis protein [Fimbriimonas sp.]